MGRLSKRIETLERRGKHYPEALVREAIRRLTTEELESYESMMARVLDEGAPEEEAEPAVRHIVRLCEEVKRGR